MGTQSKGGLGRISSSVLRRFFLSALLFVAIVGVSVQLFLDQYGFANRTGNEVERPKAYVLAQLPGSPEMKETGVSSDIHEEEASPQDTSFSHALRPSTDTPFSPTVQRDANLVVSKSHIDTPTQDAPPIPIETEYPPSPMTQDEMDEHVETLIMNIARTRSPQQVTESLERLRERVLNGRNLPPLPTEEPATWPAQN